MKKQVHTSFTKRNLPCSVWPSITEGFPTACYELYATKNCQVLVKNLNFVAGMTQRFVSTKRLIGYFSNSSKLFEYCAQSSANILTSWTGLWARCSTSLLEFEKYLMSLLAETKCHVIPATKFKFFTSTWQFFVALLSLELLSLSLFVIVTVEPCYNEPRHNEDPFITNNNWKPGRITVKYVETNPAIRTLL